MHNLGEADWCGHRIRVPLTGREPLIGVLGDRLRRRATGWGWVALVGPEGSGATRVLEDFAAVLRTAGGPTPLVVHPAAVGAAPMEPIRAALRSLLPSDSTQAMARSLERLTGLPPVDLAPVLSWLGGRSAASDQPLPCADLVARTLVSLVPCGPLLVHDFDRLDPDSTQVLTAEAVRGSVGVLTTATRRPDALPEGEVITLTPLSASQIDLLLRRWLRHTPTARRLSKALTGPTEGWPGRVVRAVRAHALAGRLRKQPRGVVWAGPGRPEDEPLATVHGDPFAIWLDTLTDAPRRALCAGALIGDPMDLGLIASVSGVKTHIVRALHAELVALRDGRDRARFIPESGRRRMVLDTLDDEARRNLAQRVAAACEARASREPAWGLVALSACLEGRTQEGGLDAVATTRALEMLGHVLPGLEREAPLPRDVLLRVIDVARSLPAVADAEDRAHVARLGRLLCAQGQAEVAGRLLPATSCPRVLEELLLRAEIACVTDNRAHAARLLEDGLAAHGTEAAPLAFDAYATLAALLASEAPAREREAWRGARRVLPRADLARRAALHVGLARLARRQQRAHAEAAHLRRAVPMLASSGSLADLVPVQARLGHAELALGRIDAARPLLASAAHGLHMLGFQDDAREAHTALADLHLGRRAFDAALAELRQVESLLGDPGPDEVRCGWHLRMARAYRGLGELHEERAHAAQAIALGGSLEQVVLAKALVAESDLRSGAEVALRLLDRAERDLRGAGMDAEAEEARAALFEAHLRRADFDAAAALVGVAPRAPLSRLGAGRLRLVRGDAAGAAELLGVLAHDTATPLRVRILAGAWHAEALWRADDVEGAEAEARRVAGWLQVADRSRRDDLVVHRVLARVFRTVGRHGRAAGHRAAARRCLDALLASARTGDESGRLRRAQWGRTAHTTAASLA